ncbi:GNAT family N-acetyltransferase [Nocardia callitridis]|uniref:GNAT family N-acetyltransferase n=1 Tax=Nocardia callitridis TaxID=648753 RepID=A0ABP9KG49_9NOCA
MNVTIRARNAADLPACATALRSVHEADGYPAVWPAAPESWLTPTTLLEAMVAEVAGAVVGQVCVADGEVPAVVRARLPESTFISVTRLFVIPALRGHGVGHRLLEAAVTAAGHRGRRAVLDVETGGRAAVTLYEREGWTRVHSGPGDWITHDGRLAWLHHYVSPACDHRWRSTRG